MDENNGSMQDKPWQNIQSKSTKRYSNKIQFCKIHVDAKFEDQNRLNINQSKSKCVKSINQNRQKIGPSKRLIVAGQKQMLDQNWQKSNVTQSRFMKLIWTEN